MAASQDGVMVQSGEKETGEGLRRRLGAPRREGSASGPGRIGHFVSYPSHYLGRGGFEDFPGSLSGLPHGLDSSFGGPETLTRLTLQAGASAAGFLRRAGPSAAPRRGLAGWPLLGGRALASAPFPCAGSLSGRRHICLVEIVEQRVDTLGPVQLCRGDPLLAVAQVTPTRPVWGVSQTFSALRLEFRSPGGAILDDG